jgi:hypothetical protein
VRRFWQSDQHRLSDWRQRDHEHQQGEDCQVIAFHCYLQWHPRLDSNQRPVTCFSLLFASGGRGFADGNVMGACGCLYFSCYLQA